MQATRRQFVKGAAALGAVGAVVQILPGCTHEPQSPTTEPTVVEAENATNVLESYSEDKVKFEQIADIELNVGSVLHAGGSNYLPIVCPGETALPMAYARALSLNTATTTDVVAMPTTEGVNWVIFDARCSDEVYAWVEVDALERNWKLFAAPFADGVLSGGVNTLWEGSSDFDPPFFCCTGKKVLWQVMPSLTGEKTTEHSFCYLWELGSETATAVVESPGRFASEPAISAGTITLAPRVDSDTGVYYAITAYSLDDDLETIVDQLVMPAAIRPFRAVRIGDSFAFSVEANYDSGGLFANMGTYIGTGDGPFVYLPREPFAEVVGNGKGLYIIKSRSSYFVIDTQAETYAVLPAQDASVDYGEYPASNGETSTFITFTTIKEAGTGLPKSVGVRTFDIA